MNGVYLRALPVFDLAERLIGFLAERGSPLAAQPQRIIDVTPLAQEKIATLADFEPLCAFLFGPITIDEEAWERVAGHERAAEILAAVQTTLASCDWTVDAIEVALRAVCDELALKPRVVFGLSASRSPAAASRPACSRACTCWDERRRWPGSPQPLRVYALDRLVTRWATTAASAWALAENARPSRDASAPSAAPAARARMGDDARAPGSGPASPVRAVPLVRRRGVPAPGCVPGRSASAPAPTRA